MTGVRVRSALPADAAACAAIYGPYVQGSVATFELDPPSAEEFAARMAKVAAAGLPWLVAETGGAIAGYAYAAPFRERAAYRFTVEDSVYVATGRERHGLGRLLLSAVIEAASKAGCRQMIAGISGPSPASVALHAALGFREAGRIENVGWKFGRWIDVVYMQRPLGAGGSAGP